MPRETGSAVEDLPPGQVPDLVAAIVARGGRVEAVVPEQQSLEASFLKLLGEYVSVPGSGRSRR